jgi:hypothetical protein
MATQREILRAIDISVQQWDARRLAVKRMVQLTGRYSQSDITYELGIMRFIDHSLMHDDGVFKFKPPRVLRGLWGSNVDHIKKVVWDLIELEKKLAREATVNIEVLKHVIYIKKVADFVLRYKYPEMPALERKRIIAGEYKQHESTFLMPKKPF